MVRQIFPGSTRVVHTIELVGCRPLHVWEEMTVGIKGHIYARVTQPLRNNFGIFPGRELLRCASVTERIKNKSVSETGIGHDL